MRTPTISTQGSATGEASPAGVGLEEAEGDDDVQVLVDDTDEEDQVDNLA